MPVDAGKTLLLDQIRKSTVQAREAGGITQHIGASFFPIDTLIEVCGSFLDRIKGEVQIPGLLVIDTPGHEAFANLRKRGGGVADIVILVIDVLKGLEAQTYECIEILKARKTPFLVAANKIDRISGWKSKPTTSFLQFYQDQDPNVRRDLDEHLYSIMGAFSRIGFQTDRFDKISDFTRTVAIVPVSAKTGSGVPELLGVLVGLTQQYLHDRLEVTEGPAKGTVLEVNEERGLGITINSIIYDGILRKEDIIVVGGKEEPIITKVRAVLLPKPLDEIRDPRDKFDSVDMVSAAAGVKIAAANLENALPGASLFVIPSENLTESYVNTISEEIEKLRIETDINGIILKTDALGSLEAIATSLMNNNVPIRLADVGDVSKRDIMEAVVVKQNEPLYGVVLAFNVKALVDAETEAKDREIPIFKHNIIYHLIDDYTHWLKRQREARLQSEFDDLIKPSKIKLLPDYIFRKAKPAIVGVDVLAGQIKPRHVLIKEDGVDIGEIMQIQNRGQSASEAKKGEQVAISLNKPVVGRHINVGDVLYVKVPESHAKILLTKFQNRLSIDEIDALNELVEIMKSKTPFWGA
ncbi:translation initiation factor IF-2 [Candidatus Bathyarchaeota archaeon]|nr:translation initiation factor IF-2 [Candidatus Bathyarchaeota archaeon]